MNRLPFDKESTNISQWLWDSKSSKTILMNVLISKLTILEKHQFFLFSFIFSFFLFFFVTFDSLVFFCFGDCQFLFSKNIHFNVRPMIEQILTMFDLSCKLCNAILFTYIEISFHSLISYCYIKIRMLL